MQYQDVKTGEPTVGTLNMGAMFKRQIPGSAIINYAVVDDFDKVLAKVEKFGGKIVMPKNEVKTVGFTSVIQDAEGNIIGLWKPVIM